LVIISQKERDMSEILRPLLVGVLCIGLTFIVMIGVVVLLSVNRSRSRKKMAIASNWPAVPGQVTAARIEESVRTRADEDVFYEPSIEFRYTVEGQVYSGKQVIGRPSNLEFKAKQTLAHYPPGTEISVYHNPEKPGEARLLIK
jgi:hypothetical protein